MKCLGGKGANLTYHSSNILRCSKQVYDWGKVMVLTPICGSERVIWIPRHQPFRHPLTVILFFNRLKLL